MYLEGLALLSEPSRWLVNVGDLLAQLLSQPRGLIIVPPQQDAKMGPTEERVAF